MISTQWRVAPLVLLVSGLVSAQTFDRPGRVETIPAAQRDWVFVDSSLVDVSDDQLLGIFSLDGAGVTPPSIVLTDDGRVFAPESFRTRGNRGERTDVVTVFDPSTLAVAAEVVIPAKRALMSPLDGATALTDNRRFLAVYNLTPAQSISIVNTESLEFVGEISTPGCSLVFGAGDLRYFMLCANGDLLNVELNADGTERSKARIQGFFNPEEDPLRENGTRYRDQWIFASFEGMARTLDVSGGNPSIGVPWSLLNERDRRQNWRIAGGQNLTVHQASGRLYSIVRRSSQPLDDPADYDGHEIWVYDLATRERIDRFEGIPNRRNSGGGGGLGGSSGDGASGIVVTQGANPLLVTAGGGGISVRNALTGEYIHETLQRAPAGGRLTLRMQ